MPKQRICFCLWVILLGVFARFSYAEPAHVEVKKHGDGQWALLVNGEPFFIKGVVYNFMAVGDDPNNGTLRPWSMMDLDQNGKVDVAYDSWVDSNGNNVQDEDEPAVGDWQLLKDLGANTLRIYQMTSSDERIRHLYTNDGARLTFDHPPDKELFRDLYNRYGIRLAIGHFFGEWTIGSGASWEKGTDYTDPVQRQNLLESIRVMVEEHKDEPYTLLWIIGNENFNPYDQDNAETQVEAFLTLVNEAAQIIHQMDPDHPVAMCNFHIDHLEDIARFAPDIDIFGMNVYSQGFQSQYDKIKTVFDRPVLITEYGTPAWGEDDRSFASQKSYHRTCWRDIYENRYGGSRGGNSIGAMVFVWSDQWCLAGNPFVHDKGESLGVKLIEWYGLVGLGDGSHSPFLRDLKRVYFLYQDFWKASGAEAAHE